MSAAMQPTSAMEPATCGATTHQAKTPCRKQAGWGTDHLGFGRCKLHGGSTPSHRRQHLRALESLVPTAIQQMQRQASAGLVAESDIPEHVRYRASADVLDRTGYAARHVHEHSGPDGGPIPIEVRQAELLDRARRLRAGEVIDTTLAERDDE